VLISGDERGKEGECEYPQFLTIRDGTVQGVVVKNEPRAPPFLCILDEEWGHTKWLGTHKLEEDEYVTLSPMGGVCREADFFIEPSQVITVGLAYNNYVGTEW